MQKTKQQNSQNYKNYEEVPTINKQWFFWISYFIFFPIAVYILLFKDVYYEKKGELKKFSVLNKIIMMLITISFIIDQFNTN
jgi:hypothetical protein